MPTAAYTRYSDDQQRQASIRDQLRNIDALCVRFGIAAPTLLFSDEAMSGARNDRPGYADLMAAADAGKFDVLVIDDFTRLARDHIESSQTIRRLKFAGIRVIGASDGTDTDRESYKLDTGMRGLMGEWYLDDLAKKTHRGLMGQALDGYSAGGLPFGYTSSSDGTGYSRAINEDQARWVRFIFERYAAGDSPRTIANELNSRNIPSPRGGTWSHTALYPDYKCLGMLANPLYNGRQIWNRTKWVKDPVTGRRRRLMRDPSEWVIHEDPQLKIIDDVTWAAVEARTAAVRAKSATLRDALKRSAGRGRSKYLFSGLLRCGECGAAYVVVDRYRYGCGAHKDKGISACSSTIKIARTAVETTLLDGIKNELLSEEAYKAFEQETRALLKQTKPDPAKARRALQEQQAKVDNLMKAIMAGIVTPTTKAALIDAETGVTEARTELEAINAYEPTQILPRAREVYRDMVDRLENLTDITSARDAIRSLIGDQISIVEENGEVFAEITQSSNSALSKIVMVAGTRSGHNLTVKRFYLKRAA